MITDLLDILKSIPNLENKIFYSPLYGDVRVKLECLNMPILVYDISYNDLLAELTKDGYYDDWSNGDREIMLYPSREERDWNRFIKNLNNNNYGSN